jgi:hypothetical protein
MARSSSSAAAGNLAQYQNQWVAIDPTAEARGPRVNGGVIVDADEELSELCTRLNEAKRRHCTIIFSGGA